MVIKVPQIGLGGGGNGRTEGIGGAITTGGTRAGGGGIGLATGTGTGAGGGAAIWIPQLEQYTASSLLSAPHSGHFLGNDYPPMVSTVK